VPSGLTAMPWGWLVSMGIVVITVSVLALITDTVPGTRPAPELVR